MDNVVWNKGLKGEEYKKHYKKFKGLADKYHLAYDKNWLIEHYYGFDMTTTEMAQILGCVRQVIINGLHKNNIPIKYNSFELWQRDKQGSKQCPNCKRWKTEDNYSKDSRRSDRLTNMCKNCANKYHEINRQTNRIIALQYYTSGTMKCSICEIEDIDVLSFDHTLNDGGEHRKETNERHIAQWLIKNNFPDCYRVLCRNCNWKERLLKK